MQLFLIPKLKKMKYYFVGFYTLVKYLRRSELYENVLTEQGLIRAFTVSSL